MSTAGLPIDELLYTLGERAKELNCIYKIEELLNTPTISLPVLAQGIVDVMPSAWQYTEICHTRIYCKGVEYKSKNFVRSKWAQRAEIIVQDKVEGIVEVYYDQETPNADEGPFLKEERKLLNFIADRIGHHILYHRLRGVFNEWRVLKQEFAENRKPPWKIILEMIRSTDQNLYTRISRKMLNHLCWSGIPEAEMLLQRFSFMSSESDDDPVMDANKPRQREELYNFIIGNDEIFVITAKYLSEQEIFTYLQKWIKDDKSVFLVDVLESMDTSLSEIADAIGRYRHISPDSVELMAATEKGLRVSLIRRFFTDQLQFINVAKDYIEIGDFYDLIRRMIYHQRSHGKLGGKSAGLFLATQIIKRVGADNDLLKDIRVPKSWYITSDGILNFIHYNNLEDVFNQKYQEIDIIRQEYPHLVQMFKNSYFSPEIIKGLSMALDDFGNKPLIVRSSSLLEDSMNAAFSGKYKSLFLANTGSKSERLSALMDAIAEVYASTFSPDPIEYRAERGLLDFHEEMGIIIQEVVGTPIGKYYLPAFSGVAFSNNEFRWSPRIRREDGLVRMVPGLGTRAVDRTADDYPILIAPGQPGLRANITPDEMMRYSPKWIDVINLETHQFETIQINDLLRECGHQYPIIHKLVSVVEPNHIRQMVGIGLDFDKGEYAVTFEGVISGSDYIQRINAIIKLIEEKLGMPVDIEFACDGKDIYLLQCRPQSYGDAGGPSPIPRDVPLERVLFTATHHISNGLVPEISHIVYVDPDQYAALPTRAALLAVGRAIGKLNKLLPRRQFILMGPGRWGSRGDIKMGVSVTYSDINSTAMLVEIARKKGNYVPDLSFGTHFFQDLVEASIRYLPLYPDADGIIFNEKFLTESHSILPEILPEFADMQHVVRVIDVPASMDGMILKVLMNADAEEAVAMFVSPTVENGAKREVINLITMPNEDHWSWRLRMAAKIASQVDGERFGVRAMYVFGSTKNATAGPGSDIDLLIHVNATQKQLDELQLWLEGWSLCLSEINYLRTGHKVHGKLLDVHFVTDEDIHKRTSYAVKIDAITDAARPLPMAT